MRIVQYLRSSVPLGEISTVVLDLHAFSDVIDPNEATWLSPTPGTPHVRLFYNALENFRSPEDLVNGLRCSINGKNIFERFQFEMSLTSQSQPMKAPFLGFVFFLKLINVLSHFAIAEKKQKSSLREKKQQILDFFEGCFNQKIISYPVKYEKTGLVTSFSSVFRDLELSLINIIGNTENEEKAWKIVEGACLLAVNFIESCDKNPSWKSLQIHLLSDIKTFLTEIQKKWLQAHISGKKVTLSNGFKTGEKNKVSEFLVEGFIKTKPFEMPPVIQKQHYRITPTTTADVMRSLNNNNKQKEMPVVHKPIPIPSAPPLPSTSKDAYSFGGEDLPTPPLTPENRSRKGSASFDEIPVAVPINECDVEPESVKAATNVRPLFGGSASVAETSSRSKPSESFFSRLFTTVPLYATTGSRNVVNSRKDVEPSAPPMPKGGFVY